MTFKKSLGEHRIMNPSKEVIKHWWGQRLTAVVLVPLTIWFVSSIAGLVGADVNTVRGWVANPIALILLLITIFTVFHHAQLGVRVVLEDYVHAPWLKGFSIALIKIIAVALGTVCFVAVITIFFTS